MALRRFLATWQRDTQRQRGREVSQEAISAIAGAEERFAHDATAHHESPDRFYDRQWVQELMRHVLEKLRDQYARKCREELFGALRPALLAGGSLAGYDTNALAESLDVRPGALRTAFHCLLEDFREALRSEILQTVETREMAKAEYEELMAVFRQG